MDPLKAYKIAFIGLSNGTHRFTFDVGPDFFACFESPDIGQSAIHLDVSMEKENNMLVFDFDFGGWVELVCGRCLDGFKAPVNHQHRLYVKFGEVHDEQSEEVVIIPHTESHVDLAQYVYEFIHLELPLQAVHPDDAPGVPGCDPDMLRRMKEHEPPRAGEKDGPGDDSPFGALRKLRFDEDN